MYNYSDYNISWQITLGQNKDFIAHATSRKFNISYGVPDGQEMLHFLDIFHGSGQDKLGWS